MNLTCFLSRKNQYYTTLYTCTQKNLNLIFFCFWKEYHILLLRPFSFCKVSIQRASNKGWHLTKKSIQEWMKLYQMNGGANWPQVQDARSIFSRVQSIKSQFDKWCHKTSNGLSLCVCPFNLSYFAPAAVVRRKGVWETLYLRAQIDFGLCESVSIHIVSIYECCFYTK